MSLHDEYARLTPFELAFPDEERLARLIDDAVEEAESRGVDPGLPGVFMTLGTVGDFVGEFQPPDAPDEAVHEYSALAFHAFHFARQGRPLYLLETEATREIVAGLQPTARPTPPTPSGYLQLPQHLFWMGGDEEMPPESVDGVFWTVSQDETLHTLMVTGVLTEHPAFRALPLPDAPLADAPAWVGADVREDGGDYESDLPGHELDRLYTVETAGEVLKLLARFFAYLNATPERVEEQVGAGPPEGSPPPSALSYTRVRAA